jgi:hypothetical protein
MAGSGGSFINHQICHVQRGGGGHGAVRGGSAAPNHGGGSAAVNHGGGGGGLVVGYVSFWILVLSATQKNCNIIMWVRCE